MLKRSVTKLQVKEIMFGDVGERERERSVHEDQKGGGEDYQFCWAVFEYEVCLSSKSRAA